MQADRGLSVGLIDLFSPGAVLIQLLLILNIIILSSNRPLQQCPRPHQPGTLVHYPTVHIAWDAEQHEIISAAGPENTAAFLRPSPGD